MKRCLDSKYNRAAFTLGLLTGFFALNSAAVGLWHLLLPESAHTTRLAVLSAAELIGAIGIYRQQQIQENREQPLSDSELNEIRVQL